MALGHATTVATALRTHIKGPGSIQALVDQTLVSCGGLVRPTLPGSEGIRADLQLGRQGALAEAMELAVADQAFTELFGLR